MNNEPSTDYLGLVGWSKACYASGGAQDQKACDDTYGVGKMHPIGWTGCGLGARIKCAEKNPTVGGDVDPWSCCWGTKTYQEAPSDYTGSGEDTQQHINPCRQCWKPGYAGCEQYKQDQCQANWRAHPQECLTQRYKCCTGALDGNTAGHCSDLWKPNSESCQTFIENISSGMFSDAAEVGFYYKMSVILQAFSDELVSGRMQGVGYPFWASIVNQYTAKAKQAMTATSGNDPSQFFTDTGAFIAGNFASQLPASATYVNATFRPAINAAFSEYKAGTFNGINYSPGGGSMADNKLNCCRKVPGFDQSNAAECLQKWKDGTAECDGVVTAYCNKRVADANGDWAKIQTPADHGLDCGCFASAPGFSPPLITGAKTPAVCNDSRCYSSSSYHTEAVSTEALNCPSTISCDVYFNTTAGGRVDFTDVTINQRCSGTQNIGGTCALDSDCTSGSCLSGLCVKKTQPTKQCTVNGDCEKGFICQNGSCIKPSGTECTLSGDCAPGQECQSGVCVPTIPTPTPTPTPTGICTSDDECQSGQWCINGICKIPGTQDYITRYTSKAEGFVENHKLEVAGGMAILGLMVLLI